MREQETSPINVQEFLKLWIPNQIIPKITKSRIHDKNNFLYVATVVKGWSLEGVFKIWLFPTYSPLFFYKGIDLLPKSWGF